MAKARGVVRRFGRMLRWAYRLALLLVIADLIYLATIWPDWKLYVQGPVPKSRFIQIYEEQRGTHKGWPAPRWQPVPITSLPAAMLRAVIVAEDSRFYRHSGFDIAAIRAAIRDAWTGRSDRYSEIRATSREPGPRLEMFAIGG